MSDIPARLEYLRQELRAERISQGELAELQGLAEHIEPGDVELLEAAGVPEHPSEREFTVTATLVVIGTTVEEALQTYAAENDILAAFIEED